MLNSSCNVVLAQINTHVGDINANLKKHIECALHARDQLHADLIIFPELSLTGYPPEDLLLRPAFIQAAKSALMQLMTKVPDIHCIVGLPNLEANALYNACAIIYNGQIIKIVAKQCLPNYGVFDECRYFTPGTEASIFNLANKKIGLMICEDLWRIQPIKKLMACGAELIIVSNASPFEIDKHETRVALLAKRAQEYQIPLIYTNMVGGQDELVFDGGSMMVNNLGEITHFAGFFQEKLLPITDIFGANHLKQNNVAIPDSFTRIYDALVCSIQDYVGKNNFSGVIIGLSGGIDSALVTTLAVDALGSERVHPIFMPSRYTAEESKTDSIKLAKNLKITLDIIDIELVYQAFLQSLKINIGATVDLVQQNIQARSRGVLLMAKSNELGYLVLNTSNRSELAVGYSTLYGDMVGGFSILKDIPKTMVYKLAQYRNQLSAVIPEQILKRAPTAELAPHQKDEDSLPSYDILDKILFAYLNQNLSEEEICKQGMDTEVVKKVISLVIKSEYKRKVAVIGPHTNHHSFGKDWRYPITNGFKG